MGLYRVAMLMAATTEPGNLSVTSAHSGGWSESHWTESVTGNLLSYIQTLAELRASMLPTQAQIIGYRQELFTISGNKLLPGGASGARFHYPGTSGTLNLPQDALMFSANSLSSANTTRFSARAIPDGQIANGEYQPVAPFPTSVQLYTDRLSLAGWGFVGRIRGTTARVNKIVGNVVTLSAAIGGTAEQSYLRFLRVYDNDGNPIKGSFLITLIAGSDYTVQGLPAGTVLGTPSGNARLDGIQFFRYGTITPSRAVSRKIGGPFERYRGRASRRR